MHHTPGQHLSRNDVSIPQGHPWNKLPTLFLVLAVVGLGASAALATLDKDRFFFSYLVAYAYWLSIAIGGFFFVIVQYATRAGWSVVVRRIAEFFMATLPVFALLFLPIALGLHSLYHWTHAETVATDPILSGKAAYLNTPFFLIRAAVYLGLWAFLSILFFRSSTRQDDSADPKLTARLQWWSAPALLIFALSVTFAAFDWIMSLEPHWYSTIYGVYFFAGGVVGCFALMIGVAVALNRQRLIGGAITVEHFHDLGKLLFAFVVFWTYIGFSQYMLIWYANLPEETIWFRTRLVGSWKTVSLMLAACHFVVPFFFLMPRTIKRKNATLLAGALWMLAMHYVDLYWLIMPTHHPEVHLSFLDLTTFIGVGGVFGFVVTRLMNRKALVAVGDPRLSESLAFENM